MKRERGVALLTAIILVALATIVAAGIAFKNGMTARRTSSAFMFDQAIQYAAATEAMAAYVLREDRKNKGSTDDFTEDWARPYGPVELTPGSGIWLEAQLDDAMKLYGRLGVTSVKVVTMPPPGMRLARTSRIKPRLEKRSVNGSVAAE